MKRTMPAFLVCIETHHFSVWTLRLCCLKLQICVACPEICIMLAKCLASSTVHPAHFPAAINITPYCSNDSRQ